jgi:IS30 family transposase
MNKHNKITALERDQSAWWLACGITIREMARRLGRNPSSISEELTGPEALGTLAPKASETKPLAGQKKQISQNPPLGFHPAPTRAD